jgi:hypothetical protein
MSTASSTETPEVLPEKSSTEKSIQIPKIQSIIDQPLATPENTAVTSKDSNIDATMLAPIEIEYAKYLDETSSYDLRIAAVESMIQLSRIFLEDGGVPKQLTKYFQIKQANVGEISVVALSFKDANMVFGTIEGNWTIIQVVDSTGIHVFVPIERDALMVQHLFVFDSEHGSVIVLSGRVALTRFNTVFMSSYVYSDAELKAFTNVDVPKQSVQKTEIEQFNNLVTFADYDKTVAIVESSSPQEPFLSINAEEDYSIKVSWDGSRLLTEIDDQN